MDLICPRITQTVPTAVSMTYMLVIYYIQHCKLADRPFLGQKSPKKSMIGKYGQTLHSYNMA